MICCEVVDVYDRARYAGTTYTQTVLCKLNSGAQWELFDPTPPKISDEMIGENIKIRALGRGDEISRTEQQMKAIEEREVGKYRYSGKIVRTLFVEEYQTESFQVDVGEGIIYLEIPNGMEGTKESYIGEYISSDTYRTDIIDLSNRGEVNEVSE